MLKFGTKNALFEYFWTRILKNYCHICNQHLQICQKWVFNPYSEFWYKSAFLKGLGSTFSEGPGSGPGPLYKVCLFICFSNSHVFSEWNKLLLHTFNSAAISCIFSLYIPFNRNSEMIPKRSAQKTLITWFLC